MKEIKIKSNQMIEASKSIEYLYTHNKNFTKAQEENATILYYLFFEGIHPYKEEEPEPDQVKETAKRLYNFLEPWERSESGLETPEETEKAIKENPIETIIYLLDLLEN